MVLDMRQRRPVAYSRQAVGLLGPIAISNNAMSTYCKITTANVLSMQGQGRAGSLLFATRQPQDNVLHAVKACPVASHFMARSLPQVMGEAILPQLCP